MGKQNVLNGCGHIVTDLRDLLKHSDQNNPFTLKSPNGNIIGSEEDLKNLDLHYIDLKTMLLNSYTESIVNGSSISNVEQLRSLSEKAGATDEEINMAYLKATEDPLYKLETHRVAVGEKN